jgi:hypothetical protein
VAAGIAKFYSDIHAALPKAKIYATSPIWDNTVTPANIKTMGSSVRKSITAIGGTYLDIGEPLLDHPELISTIVGHPNDAGHKAIADAVIAQLQSAK